jgi:hypothetical protein
MQNFTDDHVPVMNGAIDAGLVPAGSGNGSRPNDDIEKVTGRLPVDFLEFARRNAGLWTSRGAT